MLFYNTMTEFGDNKKKLMGKYKAGIMMNMGLISAFFFSCLISYTGILAIIDMFK